MPTSELPTVGNLRVGISEIHRFVFVFVEKFVQEAEKSTLSTGLGLQAKSHSEVSLFVF